MTTKKLTQLLRQNRFQEVDQFFLEVQTRFEQGALDEEALCEQFSLLAYDRIASELSLRAWLQAMPTSYAANYCAGLWLYGLGLEARGEDYAANVSQQDWRDMQQAHTRAEALFKASLPLTRAPLMSYLSLGELTRFGAHDEISVSAQRYPSWYQEGLKIKPDSKVLRIALMQVLRPEWGGSKQDLLAFVAQHKDFPDGGLLYSQLKSAECRFLLHYKTYWEDDFAGALQLYQQAVSYDAKSPWNGYWLALAHNSQDDFERANGVLREAIKAHPDCYELYFQLATQLRYLEREDELVQHYKPLLALGIYRAQMESAKALAELARRRKDKRLGQDARELFELLWEQGDASAGNFLADLLHEGDIVTKDVRKSLQIAKASADMGDRYSCHMLWTNWYFGGYKELLSAHEAAHYLQLAWRAGNPYSPKRVIQMLEEGRFLLNPDALSPNAQLQVNPSGKVTLAGLAQAFELRKQAAEEGDVEQILHLAKLMMEGSEHFPPNPVQGLYWYEMAAELDDQYAQVMLGWYYARGEVVQFDFAKAQEWLSLAVAKGDRFACYELARLLWDARGTERDTAQALSLLAQATSGEDIDELKPCYFELPASRLFYGIGMAKDPDAAKAWMLKARAANQLSDWISHQLSVFEASGLAKLLKRFTPLASANLIDPPN